MTQSDSGATWTRWEDEGSDKRSMAVGAVIASALAAGLVAFLLRRARKEEEVERTPAGLAGKAFERTRGMVGDERVEAGREFLMNKVVPEFKPALLAILEELEDATEKAFKRAEKAIKSI